MATDALSKAEAAFRRQQDAAAARTEYEKRNDAINTNMMRLRAERLVRQAAEPNPNKIKAKKGHTLPQTQGEKTRPRQPGDTSNKQNESDRP
jgi:hypothetical protein